MIYKIYNYFFADNKTNFLQCSFPHIEKISYILNFCFAEGSIYDNIRLFRRNHKRWINIRASSARTTSARFRV